VLTADRRGHSTCSGSCLATWPPTPPTSGRAAGVTAALGRTTTPGGTPTATANGLPLYTYSGDTGAGDVNGEDIHSYGGVWYAVSPAGHEIKAGSSGSTGGTGGGGYGAGY
jgi:predicted lipoprotein with Yx(FWY)xxD motif